MRKIRKPVFEEAIGRQMDLMDFLAEIPKLAQEADKTRLGFLIEEFRRQYPDWYQLILELVDVTPDQAIEQICLRWPSARLIKIYPGAPRIVAILQDEIRNRRDSNEKV